MYAAPPCITTHCQAGPEDCSVLCTPAAVPERRLVTQCFYHCCVLMRPIYAHIAALLLCYFAFPETLHNGATTASYFSTPLVFGQDFPVLPFW